MKLKTGCCFTEVRLGGKWYKRGRVDREAECHDCATKKGGVHHLGCDMEMCPKCGEQAIMCDCWAGSVEVRI